MRHRVFGRKLGRDYDHRRALFKNLSRAFFSSGGKIKTTLAKAKAVRPLVERMINRAGRGDLASRRWLFKYFQDQRFVNGIVETFGQQFKARRGGYTRILKLKRRLGDDAIIVRLELVEELKSSKTQKPKKNSKIQKPKNSKKNSKTQSKIKNKK